MEQTLGAGLEPTKKKKLNKANILMACLMVLMLAAAITFGVLWAAERSKSPASSNNTPTSNTATSQDFTNNASGQIAAELNHLYFSQEKIVNGTEGEVYGALYSDSISAPNSNSNMVQVVASAAGVNTASVTVNWQDLNTYYGSTHTLVSENRADNNAVYELEFTKNISDVFIASAGQTLGSEEILFLMEDGTVEYIPVKEAAESGEFKSFGQKEGLVNIVKFYHGTVATTSGAGGGSMSYAQDASGNIYLLYKLGN
ncbi:hypothetical protein IJ114_01045 [Candidatus Saccharibacteria bacterium]|nr:hypothetical protein [Candidatus Saccharibacteria bacterium]